jgi:putative copper export protein
MAIAIKILLVLLLIFIAFNLFRAMFSMLKQDEERLPMSVYIGRRLIWSVAVIVILLLCLMFGIIQPNPRPY